MEPDIRFCHLCERSLKSTDFNPKRKECRECSKGIKLLYRYGITQKQYDDMLVEQNGICKICLKSPEEVGILAVDHDHDCCPGTKTCGECVRGLLCAGCNVSIGRFEDDIDRLFRAVEYLSK